MPGCNGNGMRPRRGVRANDVAPPEPSSCGPVPDGASTPVAGPIPPSLPRSCMRRPAPRPPSASSGFPPPHADGPRRDRDGRLRGRCAPARATASRAKGVSPDDRSLEALDDPLGSVPGRGPGRRRRHHGGDDAAIRAGHPQGRAGRPRGRPVQGCRDLLQAGAPGRAPQRGDPRGLRRAVSRVVRAGAGRPARGPARRAARPVEQGRQFRQGRPRDRGRTCCTTRWIRTWRWTRSTGPRSC